MLLNSPLEPFLSIRWKFSGIVAASVLLMGVLSLVLFLAMDTALRSEHEAQGLAVARSLAANAADPILVDNRVQLTTLLVNAMGENREIVYAFATNAEGVVVAHTFVNAFPNDLLRVAEIPPRSRGPFPKYSTEEGIVEDIAVPIFGGKAGVLHLGFSERFIEELISETRNRILVVTAVFLGVGILVSHYLGMIFLARPLEELTLAVGELGKGNLDRRIEPVGSDEIGLLSSTFNRMADDLQQYLREKKEAQDSLQKAHDELEERVRERTAQLAAANRELEAFAYSVSHDLRAPLRGIDGFSLALLEDCGDRLDDVGRDYLQRVRNGCLRMGKLIDDLLALSRLTRSEMRREAVDLSGMTRAIVDELRREEPGRDVEVAVAEGLTVDADPSLLRVALANLLGNAWKFTRKTENARIELGRSENKDGSPVYFIRDNGAGFDMRYAERLFGAFQRLHTESEFEGTGVGLATVQRIIHRHGGLIRAEGAVGAGATFYFTLKGERG
jgi:signal transduction histidine kinase